MPVELDKALGAELPPIDFEWSFRDIILYALGVGMGRPATDPNQLKFTYENGLKVLPTYGVVPPFAALAGVMSAPGLTFNPMMLLHGEQYLEILEHPIPDKAKVTSSAKISSIYDKGKGALVNVETITRTEGGKELFKNVFSTFLRGEGGFGGESGPAPGNDAPDREPDKVVEYETREDQALLYRLSGDYNPLHADPNFAKMGGFDKPILHGLCTFGHAGRAALEAYCDWDPAKFKSIKARFSKPVMPGQTIVTQMWEESPTRILLKCQVKETGADVITNAAVELNG